MKLHQYQLVNSHKNQGRPRATTLHRRKGYNSRVNAPVPPKPAADNKRQHRHAIYAAEATGLLLVAVLLLILTIIRYWRYIPWNAH